ncbi:hypothetical protein [Methylocella sp.]|uniref:hypothetical protein n=1 Tax=Methylocella sp. TaxID=1978226 RepID=UPI003784CC33
MRWIACALGLSCVVFLASGPARAQLMLPGALQAQPETPGKPGAPAAGAPRPKPAPAKPPQPEAAIGKTFLHDGEKGTISLGRGSGEGALEISALSIEGEEIAAPGDACRIDVVASGAPIAATPVGRPNGALRFSVALEACPFEFDLLDGALLVSHAGGACVFEAAGCKADPSGLWGPAPSSFDDKQVKQFESARGKAETAMRSDFRALVAAAGKDQAAVKGFAAEQAGFSSRRETTCRSYVGEETHGFCALKLTQARSLALRAAREAYEKEKGPAKAARKGAHAQAARDAAAKTGPNAAPNPPSAN